MDESRAVYAVFVFCAVDGRVALRRDEPYARVVVPDHQRMRRGTLRKMIHEAGLTVDEFVSLL